MKLVVEKSVVSGRLLGRTLGKVAVGLLEVERVTVAVWFVDKGVIGVPWGNKELGPGSWNIDKISFTRIA